jgi:hypothetical protein
MFRVSQMVQKQYVCMPRDYEPSRTNLNFCDVSSKKVGHQVKYNDFGTNRKILPQGIQIVYRNKFHGL